MKGDKGRWKQRRNRGSEAKAVIEMDAHAGEGEGGREGEGGWGHARRQSASRQDARRQGGACLHFHLLCIIQDGGPHAGLGP